MLSGTFRAARHPGVPRAPHLVGTLRIPGRAVVQDISFLVDTGADFTALFPADGLAAGISYDALSPSFDAVGIGGKAQTFDEKAIVTFRNGSMWYGYFITLKIFPPGKEISSLPSILGRDILNRMVMHYAPSTSRLEFEVVDADFVS